MYPSASVLIDNVSYTVLNPDGKVLFLSHDDQIKIIKDLLSYNLLTSTQKQTLDSPGMFGSQPQRANVDYMYRLINQPVPSWVDELFQS